MRGRAALAAVAAACGAMLALAGVAGAAVLPGGTPPQQLTGALYTCLDQVSGIDGRWYEDSYPTAPRALRAGDSCFTSVTLARAAGLKAPADPQGGQPLQAGELLLYRAPKELAAACAAVAAGSGVTAWCPDRLPPGAFTDGLCEKGECQGGAEQGAWAIISRGQLYGFAAARTADVFVPMGISLGMVKTTWRTACRGVKQVPAGISVGGAAASLLNCDAGAVFVVWRSAGIAYALHAPTPAAAKGIARRLVAVRGG